MRSIISRTSSVATTSNGALHQLQRRTVSDYMAVFQTQATLDSAFGKTMNSINTTWVNPKLNQKPSEAAAQTGSVFNTVYDEESIFNTEKFVELEAKRLQYTTGSYSSKYVVPAPLDTDVTAAAVETFARFGKDVDHVELYFRKIIRTFPALVSVVGTPAEISAFEATEAAKIPNNKLIVGRVNAKVHHVNIRDEIFSFFSTLVHMSSASEAEIQQYASPIFERWIKDSFLSVRSYVWRFEEELVRSMATLPTPATNYEIKCITHALERGVKASLNAVADLPWASEDYSCPSRGFDMGPSRACAEAGMW